MGGLEQVDRTGTNGPRSRLPRNGRPRDRPRRRASAPRRRPAAFELDSFESVDAGGGSALLRLAGRWLGSAPPVGRTKLVLFSGGSATRRVFAALPGGSGRASEGNGTDAWRATFAVPSEVLEGDYVFALRLPPSRIVVLPAAVPRELGPPAVAARDTVLPRIELPRPRLRLRLHPLVRQFLYRTLLLTSVLFLAEAIVTTVWQEPFTSLYTKLEQKGLDSDLEALQREDAAASAPAAGARTRGVTPRQWVALRARGLARRTGTGDAVGRIRLPAIGGRFVVVEGTGRNSLSKGPGHYPETPLPGAGGTAAIAGHRTTYGAPFGDIDKLERGHRIIVDMPYGQFSYAVERTRIVSPRAVWITKPVGYSRIVLSACHPKYSAAQRIVVFGRLESFRLTEQGRAALQRQ